LTADGNSKNPPLSTKNFPSFEAAVNLLREKFVGNGKNLIVGTEKLIEASEFWLDQFNENADVRQLYMLAVSCDVNTLRIGKRGPEKSSTLEILYRIFGIAVANQATNDKDFLGEYKEKMNSREEHPCLAAHYSVVAAAAQQLHRGIPHAVFQVGGREKLCEVVAHLVQDLTEQISGSKEPSEFAKKLTLGIIHEVFELTQSVFQAADTLAVITLSQCLCKELAPIVALGQKKQADRINTRRKRSKDQYQLTLDYRRLLQHQLKLGFRSKVSELMAAYLTHLAVGTTESDQFFDDSFVLELK
jgi:hypothetical protein